ncbi:hypothetical protein GQ54DRAFT_297053 [Martensiomyces pterosporus]|nr:hypothetical protein GQ54DRAFT_297053 [Martensiomyces pterosporus]
MQWPLFLLLLLLLPEQRGCPFWGEGFGGSNSRHCCVRRTKLDHMPWVHRLTYDVCGEKCPSLLSCTFAKQTCCVEQAI